MCLFHFRTAEKLYARSCQNVCDALSFLLDLFLYDLYRQVEGIPMGTDWVPPVADLFLFCYKRDLIMSLFDDNKADSIDPLILHQNIRMIF